MTQYRVKKSALKGEIVVPPSKSHTLRAILFAALARGKSMVRNYLPSTDAQSMIEACRILGAKLNVTNNEIEIEGINGKLHFTEDVINAGNSGIVLRFCSAIGALAKHPVVITGDHSIRHQRPMKPLLDALSQLDVSAVSMRGDNYAPVIIQGPLLSGKAVVNGEDSQPVSSLLIASAFASGTIDIEVVNPGELPWIDLTLYWLKRLGIKYENHAYKHYRLFGNSSYPGFDYTVPGDFSSAAFPIAAALVTGSELTLKNIDMDDPQGDKELIHVLKKMGADIRIDEKAKTLEVKKGGTLKGMDIDINNFIDAITILAVIACHAEGETNILNAAVAKQKECNRIQCIATELKKMGADITETENGLRIRKSALHGANVHTYNDHRMAMSLAVAGMNATGETEISPTNCIAKTFPSFLQDFQALGADIFTTEHTENTERK
jgi:3-phosphoshikimate 1-carboxyvinyltransferase